MHLIYFRISGIQKCQNFQFCVLRKTRIALLQFPHWSIFVDILHLKYFCCFLHRHHHSLSYVGLKYAYDKNRLFRTFYKSNELFPISLYKYYINLAPLRVLYIHGKYSIISPRLEGLSLSVVHKLDVWIACHCILRPYIDDNYRYSPLSF